MAVKKGTRASTTSKKAAGQSAVPSRARGKTTAAALSQAPADTEKKAGPPPPRMPRPFSPAPYTAPPKEESSAARLQKQKRSDPGRPAGTPDKWTDDYINYVAEQMLAYAEATAYPTVAEFCWIMKIHYQRLNECDVLRRAKELMQAKLATSGVFRGVLLQPGEAALGSFLQKLLANTGPFSMVDKTDVGLTPPSDADSMTPEERDARLAELLAKAGK